MTNYEYLQSIPIEAFHSFLAGISGIDKIPDPETPAAFLMEWLKGEKDEGFNV